MRTGRQLGRVFTTNIGIVAMAAAVVGLVAVATSALQPSRYQADAVLMATDRYTGARLLGDEVSDLSHESQTLPETQMEAIQSSAIAEAALKRLGVVAEPESLLDRVTLSRKGKSDIFTLSVVSTDAVAAAREANALANAYIAHSASAQKRRFSTAEYELRYDLLSLRSTIKWHRAERRLYSPDRQQADFEYQSLCGQYLDTSRKIRALRDDAVSASGDVEVVSRAVVNRDRISPRPLFDGLLGLIAGLALGAAIVLVFGRSDSQASEDSPV